MSALGWIGLFAAWMLSGSLFALMLGRVAAPATEAERKADDEAQIDYLRRRK